MNIVDTARLAAVSAKAKTSPRLRMNDNLHAMHDPTEGGLATGVRELAMASGCGAIISRSNVKLMPETAMFADVLGLDPLGMLASGSLLACVPASEINTIELACAEHNIPYSWIGKITPAARGYVLRDGNTESELPAFDTDEVARALMEHTV